MEKSFGRTARNDSVEQINEQRFNFFCKMVEEVNHIVLDASVVLQHLYVDEKGRECGMDAEPFWHNFIKCAKIFQQVKYPDGKEKLILMPNSCVVEIMKKAFNVSNSEPEHLIAAAEKGLKILDELHALGVFAQVDDASMGKFGDGALHSMAMNANSREKLLFIVCDKPLGRDLIRNCNMESIRMNHKVYSFDKYGFLCPISVNRNNPGLTVNSAENFTVRPRGKGSIHLYRCAGPAPSMPDSVLNAEGTMKQGDKLFLSNGIYVVLGKKIGSGRESDVFAVEGRNDCCVKVITNPSFYKQQRVNLLCSRDFDLPCCIFPELPLFNEQGTFKAYAMRRIPDNSSIPLAYLFDARMRQRYLPEQADRRFYAQLSLSLARMFYAVHLRGIMLCDISSGNVRVALDENKKAQPNALFLIDMDSAQLGTDKCVYGGDGMTPAYKAPELHNSAWNGEPIPYSAELFSVSLLICQALLCGAFPFTSIDVAADEPFDELKAVREGKFPYGSTIERRAVGTKAPGIRSYLWSNMPSALKDIMHKAMTADPKDRPKLQNLIPILEEYNAWIERDDALNRYPMIRELLPTAYKPYWHKCSDCGCKFDVPNTEGSVCVGNICLCPACAAKPVAVCRNPGCNHVTLTRGEEVQGHYAKAYCPECFKKKQEQNASKLSHYKMCSCGRSFSVSIAEARSGHEPERCPVCLNSTAAEKAAVAPAGPVLDSTAVSAEPKPAHEPKHAGKPAPDSTAVSAEPKPAHEPKHAGKPVNQLRQSIEDLFRFITGYENIAS